MDKIYTDTFLNFVIYDHYFFSRRSNGYCRAGASLGHFVAEGTYFYRVKFHERFK